jgi:hypothetical protein
MFGIIKIEKIYTYNYDIKACSNNNIIMSALYWSYETSIEDSITISIRAGPRVQKSAFDTFFTNFVCKYSSRIKLIDINFDTFVDGSHVIMIYLNGRDPIEFQDKR